MGMLEAELRTLLDEREIRAVLARYCRGVDRCDIELIASCFHEDAQDDHGNWLARGRDIAPHIVSAIRPGDAKAMHFMGNVLIEIEGDIAFAESYLLAFRAFDRDGKPYTRTRALRFVDRLERRDNTWRISERVVVDDWNRIDEVLEVLSDSELLRYSSKDKLDPVYGIRAGRVARPAPTYKA